MKHQQTVLIIGATGAMGRHVIANIHGWNVRALTRNTNSAIAQALGESGSHIELFEGNTSSEADMRAAMQGVDAVFINTDFWTNTDNPENERAQMLLLLKVAKELKVEQVIFSSLENCMSDSAGNIPVTHFDSKAIVEQEINWQRSLEHFKNEPDFYSNNVMVLRTLPYFENLMSFFPPQKDDQTDELVFTLPIGDKPFSMVALDDIGWFTNHILNNWSQYAGKTLSIGSEAVTGMQIAQQFSDVTGIKARYQPIDDEVFLSAGGFAHDALNHFVFHREIGMPRQYDELRAIHPGLRTFSYWLKETGWLGETRLVQKKLAE